jgi:hypothetical protein
MEDSIIEKAKNRQRSGRKQEIILGGIQEIFLLFLIPEEFLQ